MDKTGYERYGLTGNPFRDLSSESLDNVEIFHVRQKADDELRGIMEEIVAKENKAVVALLGGLGAGKTERLLMLEAEAQRKGVFMVMRNITAETRWVVKVVCEGMIEAAKGKKKGLFSSSGWQRDLAKIAKNIAKGYDPEQAGMAIADALNRNAPSILMLNDLHVLQRDEDTDRFMHALHVIFDRIDKGVMVMLTSDAGYFDYLMIGKESLSARINKRIAIQPLSVQEACLMIAKRLLSKRVVEDMQPLYPFTEQSVMAMNASVKGNPRELLKAADKVIDQAATKRIIQVDEEFVRSVLGEEAVKQAEPGGSCPPSDDVPAAP